MSIIRWAALLDSPVNFKHKLESRTAKSQKINGLSPCWLWLGACNGEPRGGYGKVTFTTNWNGVKMSRSYRVHRLMKCLDQYPDNFLNRYHSKQEIVLHICHVRQCCNPEHLRFGEASENMLEAAEMRRRWYRLWLQSQGQKELNL